MNDIKRRALGMLKSRPVKSYREVAESLGLHLSTVYRWGQAAGIHKPDSRRLRANTERDKEMRKLRRKHSLSELAARYGVTKQRVHQILKR